MRNVTPELATSLPPLFEKKKRRAGGYGQLDMKRVNRDNETRWERESCKFETPAWHDVRFRGEVRRWLSFHSPITFTLVCLAEVR